MKNSLHITKLFCLALCVLVLSFIFAHGKMSYAQEIQVVPISPAKLTQPSIQVQQPILKQQLFQPAQTALPQQPPFTIKPPVEELSEFEQYISAVFDITKTQLEILQKYGISFSRTIGYPPQGKTKIAIRIVKEKDKQGFPTIVDAGFLIATQEQLSTAFNILGIKSPFSITTGIKQFGYDLFLQPPSTFAP
ncbi:MAG: polysaccharide export protein, partial [Thermodesulfovibrionia bacterium]|nr:polysaccharide export protein [Thermodesulfovibrionia bacterium]